ncbi:thiamine pyrophosphate-binding protein [Candidatus Parvarchaeota archaeon]|nr:thiamine pyrophosphate-binding protein [Candidatus Parvarchaeota archaeon]
MEGKGGRGLVRVADYIAGFVAAQKASKVFMVVGGFSMHLTDAISRQQGVEYVCMHHEQACVMAAEGYARETGGMGVACVTAGPGMTNTLTGVISAHFDSSPVMVIAGQTKASVVKAQGIRQYGVQGFDSLPLFKTVAKYAVMIEDPNSVRYHMEKAAHLARSGRPGVVWIEVPLDVQPVMVDPETLAGYVPDDEGKEYAREVEKKLPQALELLSGSKRPLFLFGNGVRLSGCAKKAIEAAQAMHVPFLTSRLNIDMVESDHRLYVGRPGTYGQRAANFAVQGCDLLIVVGCRLSMSLTGYGFRDFAKNAKKIYVDVDEFELAKPSMDSGGLKIRSDAAIFLEGLLRQAKNMPWPAREKWLAKCAGWKRDYPTVLEEYMDDGKGINSYLFTKRLSDQMGKDDTIVVDTSSSFHVVAQAFEVKRGQKYITTGGLSTMGYGLPAAIGAASAKKSGRVVAIIGDGCLQMNIQELQTLVHHKLPVKIFIWTNNGYLLIRHTQRNFQDGRLVGESPKTGMSCPDTQKIAKAYGIKSIIVSKISGLDDAIKEALESPGHVICEVISPEDQLVIPRVASEKLADGTMVSKPFDDMFPFLDRQTYIKETTFQDD